MIYSEKQLNKKDFLEEIKEKYEDMVIYDRFNEAYRLAKSLDASIDKIKDFKERYYELYVQYKKIIHRLKWVGLPIMTENMVINMFKHHFTEVFKIPEFTYDEFWRKVDAALLGIIILTDRNKFKKELRNALMNNEEKISSKKIIIGEAEKFPTISNWVHDYNSLLGTEVLDNLKRTQYLTNGKNIKNLNKEEKKRVKFLLNTYEKLKLSSLTLEGVEEDIPVDDDNMKGIIKRGIFEPYKETKEDKLFLDVMRKSEEESKAEVGLNELREMLNQYPAGSLERKVVEEEIAKLESGKL